MPAPNLTCGRCRFCLDGVSPYYLCTSLHDYGNSLTCAEPPHLFGGWSERMYLLPGTRLFRVPDELPSEIAALTEVMAVTHGLDAALGFGDTVLVLGVGPLGLMHLAKAEMLGAGRLIAVDVLPERLEHARRVRRRHSASTRRRRLPRSGAARSARRPAASGRTSSSTARGAPRRSPRPSGLVRPGGTVVEAGAFVDLGPVQVNPNRDVCSPGVAILGIGGETLPQYAPALRMLARHAGRLPFARAITHSVALEGVGEALETAQTGAAMKMLVAPERRSSSRSG